MGQTEVAGRAGARGGSRVPLNSNRLAHKTADAQLDAESAPCTRIVTAREEVTGVMRLCMWKSGMQRRRVAGQWPGGTDRIRCISGYGFTHTSHDHN